MFPLLVRSTLEIYLREKRIITQSEFPPDTLSEASSKDAVFITLYYEWRVIASTGRIQCKKENSLFECVDNTLLCLKDERFAPALQVLESLDKIRIRVDRFAPKNRRVLSKIDELDIRNEWLILLAQNLSALSIILPHMVHVGSTPESYLELAAKKAWVDITSLDSREYVLYGLTTVSESDFE